jgi:hypothetical protein
MFCPACAHSNPPGANWCAACGNGMPNQMHPPAPHMSYGHPSPYYAPSPVTRRTSGMAIAGFVLSFFCGILGLIFSIMGYNETKREPDRVEGQGLAIAGIVISIVTTIIGILYAIMLARLKSEFDFDSDW